MRILHLIDRFDYCDGCARHLYFLAKGQEQIGHDVEVVAGKGDALALLEKDGISVSMNKNIHHADRSIGSLLKGVLGVALHARRFKPDIIHSHHYYAANISRMVSSVLPCSTVMTVHANIPLKGKLPLWRGDRIIAVSETIAQEIVRKNRRLRSKVVHVKNGSDFLATSNEPRQETLIEELRGLRGERNIVLFSGRLEISKGIFILVEALRALNDLKPIHLAIAGAGSSESALKRAVDTAGIPATFFGSLRNVKPVFELSDVIVLPSLYWEGLPMTLIEAGLLKKAVVATRVDGIPEIIADGTSGLLVSPGDSNELSIALGRILADPELSTRLGNTLQRTVQQSYSIQGMVKGVEDVYASLKVKPFTGDPP